MGPALSPAGLVLSPAAEPFPQKLVDKIRSGQFVDMKELLADNVLGKPARGCTWFIPHSFAGGQEAEAVRNILSLHMVLQLPWVHGDSDF